MLSVPALAATPQHEDLCETIRKTLGPWRRFLIAIDGRDGAGKSTLGRYLAWQLGMPLIEADLFLVEDENRIHRQDDLKRAISRRLDHPEGRPVIVESIFVLKLLSDIGSPPDFIVRVVQAGVDGSFMWQSDFASYEKRYADVGFKFVIENTTDE